MVFVKQKKPLFSGFVVWIRREGKLAGLLSCPQLNSILGSALVQEDYQGVISFESVYKPENSTLKTASGHVFLHSSSFRVLNITP